MKLKSPPFKERIVISAALIWALLAGIHQIPDTELLAFRTVFPDDTWADNVMKTLSLREKIAQLIQIRVAGTFTNRESPQFTDVKAQILQNELGGVVLFAGNVYESAVLLNELQTISKLPLLVTADFERGASFRISDTTSFPWAMAIGATGSEQYAYQQGLITAREARSLGVHWILAPVMDVNNNPNNPVINIRSFGESPQLVARLGSAFIRGARIGGVLTTAKHFPGHGDTSTDSHLGLPVVQSDINRLQSVELVPFRRAIEAGVDSIMTAHIALPQITGNPPIPATLSSRILTDLLRRDLGFHGLIVTDALEMNGVTDRYWCGLAAIRAIQAGADVLLLPTNPVVAIREIERAVKRGDISEGRIDESVKKVLLAKSSLDLQHSRTVSIDRIEEVVSSPDNLSVAQEIADHSITVVKDQQGLIPINPIESPRVFSLVLSSSLESSPAAIFQAEMSQRFSSIRTMWANTRISDELVRSIESAAASADIIVLSTLVRLTSGANSIGIPKRQRTILNKILTSRKRVIWVAFGNPYVFKLAPQAGTYMCTFSYSDVSQIAAARALSGEIGISGTTPVSIPNYFEIGDGLRIPKLEMTLKTPASETTEVFKNSFEKTRRILESLAAEGVFSRGELVVGHKSSVILDYAFGKHEISGNTLGVSPNTIYDIGGLSKIVASTSAAMLSVESGSLILDAPVQDYLPEFKGRDKSRVKIRDLLADASGLPESLQNFTEIEGYDNLLTAICSSPLVFSPATKVLDSELNRILIEEIVSRASGLPFDRFLMLCLLDPLKMETTFINPSANFIAQIARETGYEVISSRPGASGAARIFCRAHDLAVFAQMMLNGGIYDHRRYFSPKTISQFTESRKSSSMVVSLGWLRPSRSNWTGSLFSEKAFGYNTPAGPSLWIDPAKQLFIILLSGSKPESAEIKKIVEARKLIHEAVIDELPTDGRH